MTTTNPEHQPRPTKLPKGPPAPFVIISHRLRVLFTALNYSSISDVLSSISALLEDLNRAYRELTAVRDATEFPLDLGVIRHKHLDIRFQLIEYSVKNAKNPNALSRTQPFPEWARLGYPLVPRSKPITSHLSALGENLNPAQRIRVEGFDHMTTAGARQKRPRGVDVARLQEERERIVARPNQSQGQVPEPQCPSRTSDASV
jgi:hypothetical protein